jgi:hypothetical protein
VDTRGYEESSYTVTAVRSEGDDVPVTKQRPPRPKRTDKKLAAASEHLRYEIDMLYGSLGELETLERARVNDEAPSLSLKNALIESWTIHLRNLHEFFFRDRSDDSDMLAIDYFHDLDWFSVRKGHGLNLSTHRIPKEIVHLTWSRTKVTPDKKQWDLGPITDRITREAVRPFVENVPKSRVHPDFKTACTLAMSIRPLVLKP